MTLIETLNRFEGVSFPLEVELGTFQLSVREILGLQQGAVLRTDHVAKTPLMLRAGGTPIATVDVLVVKDALCARVTKMLAASASAPAASAAAPR